MTKIVKPIDPLIYKTAAEMACVFYEVGRSQGMTSIHKGPRQYAKANLEKFVPLAIKHLIEMLKPTANTTEHMKQAIHAALTNPINDPELMEAKVDPEITVGLISKEQRAFEKRKIQINTPQSNLLSSTGFTSPKVH